MTCRFCNTKMQQDLDSQGRLEWFCLNPDCWLNIMKQTKPEHFISKEKFFDMWCEKDKDK